jgi:hypothetical protein
MRNLVTKIASRVRRTLRIEEATGELTTRRRLLARTITSPVDAASKVSQLILLNQYRDMVNRQMPLPSFEDVEFRAFSQNGEDGVLLFVFALIGMGRRRCVEICAGDGIQCNTANLIVNHGWHGLLFDGNQRLIQDGRAFYSRLGDTFCYPPRLVSTWITRENVNQIVQENGFEGPVDLLSLDLDGVDYWVWESLDVIRPRAVITEIQCVWGSDRAVTVPYAHDFRSQSIDQFKVYSGASLPAFVKLARRKGYRLVGVQRLGFNAVFVAAGVGEDVLPEVDVDSCVDHPFVAWAQRELLPKVSDLKWVDV